ncbi:hypothetical protein C5S39_12115 [Candidatus Methanophagaceae archaeon]|nr:hypothetical protein C5S39_12115 [Methanophagales archaeon]
MHIAVDYLLYPVEKHVKWISRPISYIIQYYRIKEVYNLVSRLIRWNASNYFVYKPLMEFLESAKSSDELVDTLQSILGVVADMGTVCLC